MDFWIINPVTNKKVKVGELKEGIFYKKVKISQKLKILDTYGIEETVIEDLKERGCKKIVLNEEDTGRKYEVSFDIFYKKALRKTFGKSSYQAYLPLSYWYSNENIQQISFLQEVI